MPMIPRKHTTMMVISLALALALAVTMAPTIAAMALANKQVSVSQLLQTHADDILRLKEVAAASQTTTLSEGTTSTPYYANDVFFLRHCLDHPEDTAAQQAQLEESLQWRLGPGKAICKAAAEAVQKASIDANQWDNQPIVDAAPHSSLICKYITPQNSITTTTSQDDLVYCICAGQIDDKALMSEVTIEQMTEFFLYAKEVNNLVVNQRSLSKDRLLGVLTANDLSGIKLVGGSADFRKALSASSKQASTVYPESTTGPTLLLNLPKLLSALVKVFTPLFPPVVKERLRFAQGPLAKVNDLRVIAQDGSKERNEFLQQLDELVYSA